MDWSALLHQYSPAFLDVALQVLGVVLALFAAWVLAGGASRLLRRTLEARAFDATLTRFFAKLLRYAILTFAVIACLGLFGIQTASFAALLAAAGLAIGLAFQGTLSNFAAGMMLLVFRPFKVGDAVNVDGQVGSVEEIELFSTELKTPDGRRIILPNSSVFGNKIENISHHPQRRVEVQVGTDYGADLDNTRRVLESVFAHIPGALTEPAPQVFLAGLGASSIDWRVRVWAPTDVYWDVHQAAVAQVKKALDAAKIAIPFPQQDIHLDAAALKALGR